MASNNVILDFETCGNPGKSTKGGWIQTLCKEHGGDDGTTEDDQKIFDDVYNTVRNNLTKTVKYEAIRDAWFPGVIYNEG